MTTWCSGADRRSTNHSLRPSGRRLTTRRRLRGRRATPSPTTSPSLGCAELVEPDWVARPAPCSPTPSTTRPSGLRDHAEPQPPDRRSGCLDVVGRESVEYRYRHERRSWTSTFGFDSTAVTDVRTSNRSTGGCNHETLHRRAGHLRRLDVARTPAGFVHEAAVVEHAPRRTRSAGGASSVGGGHDRTVGGRTEARAALDSAGDRPAAPASLLVRSPPCPSSTRSTTSTASAPMELKDLLGGKGANLAEMTSVLGLPVPPGLHDHHRRLPRLHGRRLARRARRRDRRSSVTKLEKEMGRKLGDPADPLLVSVRSGAKFSMPGMMDTVLNLGLNDESVEGLAKQTDDERFAFDSLPPLHRHVRPHRARRRRRARSTRLLDDGQGVGRRHRPTPTIPRRRRCAACAQRYKDGRRASTPAQPFPQDPTDAAAGRGRGRVPLVERRPGRSPTASASASPTTSAPRSTCRRWCSATATTTPAPASASPATRPPARTGRTATSSSTPRARTSWPASATPRPSTRSSEQFPKIHDELLAIFDRLEEHYRDMCDTEFTIEQGKLWMLQTRVGKRTGAAALRMAVEMTKDERMEDHPGGGGPAGHRRAPRPGAAPAVRGRRPRTSSPRASPRRPGAAVGQGVLHRRRRGRRRRPGREGHPRAQRDLARGRARHAGGRGHPHRPGRAGQPRRRRRPRLGQARRSSAPRRSRSTASRSPPATSRCNEGDVISLDGTTGEVVLGEVALSTGRAAGRVRDDPRRGPTRSARASSPCGPTPTTAPTPPTPASSAPRASACAAPSTCSSARTGCRSCGA